MDVDLWRDRYVIVITFVMGKVHGMMACTACEGVMMCGAGRGRVVQGAGLIFSVAPLSSQQWPGVRVRRHIASVI